MQVSDVTLVKDGEEFEPTDEFRSPTYRDEAYVTPGGDINVVCTYVPGTDCNQLEPLKTHVMAFGPRLILRRKNPTGVHWFYRMASKYDVWAFTFMGKEYFVARSDDLDASVCYNSQGRNICVFDIPHWKRLCDDATIVAVLQPTSKSNRSLAWLESLSVADHGRVFQYRGHPWLIVFEAGDLSLCNMVTNDIHCLDEMVAEGNHKKLEYWRHASNYDVTWLQPKNPNEVE